MISDETVSTAAAERIERRIAERIRERRGALGLSLEQLAQRTGVSRAMISRIERAESSPTAGLLYRLGNGLGLSVSALMQDAEPATPALSRRAQQLTWRDPETGFLRRLVSPAGTGSAVEIIEVELPAGAKVAYGPAEGRLYDQHVLVLAGRLELDTGSVLELGPGDCAHMGLERGLAFTNRGREPARYLVVLRQAAGRAGRSGA